MKRPLNEEGSNQTNSLAGDSIVPNSSGYREEFKDILWAYTENGMEENIALDIFMDILNQSNVEVLDRLVESLPEKQAEYSAFNRTAGFNQAIEKVKAIIERQKQELNGEER